MSIERLIRLAGEREMPSTEAMERARSAAEASWRQALRQAPARPVRWRLWVPLACAAALGALVLMYRGTEKPVAVPVPVAQVVTLQGGATLQDARGEGSVTKDTAVFAGMTLATREGRVAVAIPGGLSLRLDHQTRLQFDGPEHVTLLTGSLYVDSGGLNAGPSLSVRTPAGEVSHVGTQFQVSVSGQTTQVRVREGRVALEGHGGVPPQVIAAGDGLEIRGSEEHWLRGLATYGPDWEWATQLARPLEIEDRPLAEFLAWLAREHGWQVRYGSDTLQQRMHDIRLHGSFDGLETTAMLERVALVTGVPLDVRDGVLWVGAQ